MSTATLSDQTMLTIEQLGERLQVSESSIRRMVARGELPRPIKLHRCRRWLLADLELWERCLSTA